MTVCLNNALILRACEVCGVEIKAYRATKKFCNSCNSERNRERSRKARGCTKRGELKRSDCAVCGADISQTMQRKYCITCGIEKERESKRLRMRDLYRGIRTIDPERFSGYGGYWTMFLDNRTRDEQECKDSKGARLIPLLTALGIDPKTGKDIAA